MSIFFFLIFFPIIALLFVFWIWTLIDVLTKEPSEGNEKLIWVVIVFFAHFIGSLLYHFIRRPERMRLYGK